MTPKRIGSRESSHPRSRHRRGQIVQAQWFRSFINSMRRKFPDHVPADINLGKLAALTLNYTRAEIQSVVQHVWISALYRIYPNSPGDENRSKVVTMDDFVNALKTAPELGIRRPNGMVGCGDRHKHIYKKAMQLVKQVKGSTGSLLVTCLLEGPNGSGKTALAATVGINSGFRCVKFVSAETMLGQDEGDKCQKIMEVFDDAYKSSMSIIILDDLERLLEYIAIGPQFSGLMSKTLLNLLKRPPPEGKRLLVIGTTSKLSFLDSVGVSGAFSVTRHVPTLKTDEVKEVLERLNVFSEDDVHEAAKALNDMPLKKIYMLLEMARVGRVGAGIEKIDMADFDDCLQDIRH